MAAYPIFGQDWLDKQLSMPLSKSFLRLDFRLVMNYLLLKKNEEKTGLTVDVVELEDFSELIEGAFNAICDEQHLQFVRKCDKGDCYKNHLNVKHTKRRHEKCSPTIIKWALLETSKYCLEHKLRSDESIRQFLTLLKNEVASPFHHSDRINRQYLIVFLSYMERLPSKNWSQGLMESWFDRNRRLFAQLSLIVDRPYDSWRHVNLKLLTDLAIRYSTRDESRLLVEPGIKISMSRAIRSLNTDKWKANLKLIAQSAREMGDSDLIYGLQTLIKNCDIVNKNWQAIDLIRCNMTRDFEGTYQKFLDTFERTNQSASDLVGTLDQLDLIEFLDACIELERLAQHTDMLDLLKSEELRSLYKLCFDSATMSRKEDLLEVHDIVMHWVSTWTLEPGCKAGEPIQPASSVLSLVELVTQNLKHSPGIKRSEETVFALTREVGKDFDWIDNGVFDVVRADLTSLGMKFLKRGSTKGSTSTSETGGYAGDRNAKLTNILSSEQELPQLVKQFFISDQTESAEISEDRVAKVNLEDHAEKLEKNPAMAVTVALVCKTLNDQLRAQQENTKIDIDLLNTSFNYDIQLLLLSTEDGYASATYPIVETAASILNKIKNHALLLSESNLRLFKRSLLPHVVKTWLKLKNNLVSIATSCHELPRGWIDAITNVIHAIALAQPNVLLYECVVTRLELQCKLAGFDGEILDNLTDESLLLHCQDQQQKPSRRAEHIRLLRFWEGLYQHMLEKGGENIPDWTNIVAQTETFLKEIRKISYLPGEYFKSLTIRLYRRLNQFLNMFKKHADPRSGLIRGRKHLDECKTRLNAIYKQDSKSISVLRIYFERMRNRNDRTIYESNLCSDLLGPLKELEYRFQLLAGKWEVLISSELEKLVRSITELISLCHTKVIRVHHAFKQKLYLESISPFLSRLKSGSVIMPEFIYSDNTCSSSSIYYSECQQESTITIHKISQNVQMIHSKTAPKKISFIGSDGVTRSYLLKAHEDLRLDRLLMELSGVLNSVLACREDMAKYGYSLKRYSVTPVSNRSGLIQWIEAPSLHSFYRTWFQSCEGRSTMRGIYKKTCQILCAKPESEKSEDHNCCHGATVNQTIHPFYQLLWAQIKKRDPHVGANFTKPSVDNTLRYRQELPHDIYEDVVEQLMANIPQDLIANQLWLASSDSKSYYISTRNFIRSCAAHSVFGYIVGLGDRHPDNILVELKTGRVAHIDHNICFEAGRDLTIPEQVPFRLTQSMVRAFGFAGLEGGFTLSCQRILRALRESRHIILNYLDPVNLTFMIGQDVPTSGAKLDQTPRQGLPKRTMSDLSVKAHHYSPSLMKQTDLDETVSSNSWGRAANNPPRHEPRGWGDDDDDDDGDDNEWAPPDNSSWGGHSPNRSREYLDHDHRWELSPSLPSPPPRPPRVRLQVHDIEEVSEDTMFLPQVLPPPEKMADRATADCAPIEDFQINIKTPKKITAKLGHDIQTRVRDKLTGNDEQLRSKILASASNNATAPLRKDPAELGQDLISLNEEALSIEDQVNCLITEALSNKNKAAMFEGWSPWV